MDNELHMKFESQWCWIVWWVVWSMLAYAKVAKVAKVFSQIVIRVKLVVKPSFHGISYMFVSQAQIRQTEICLFRWELYAFEDCVISAKFCK